MLPLKAEKNKEKILIEYDTHIMLKCHVNLFAQMSFCLLSKLKNI